MSDGRLAISEVLKLASATLSNDGFDDEANIVDGNLALFRAAPDILAACKDWLWYAESALSEFDNIEPCDQGDNLCPRCVEAGCITLKIQILRAAIAKATNSNP